MQGFEIRLQTSDPRLAGGIDAGLCRLDQPKLQSDKTPGTIEPLDTPGGSLNRILVIIAAITMTGCYQDDLLDGTVTVFEDTTCVGTELTEGWAAFYQPPDGHDPRWGVRATCEVDNPPTGWPTSSTTFTFDMTIEEFPTRYFGADEEWVEVNEFEFEPRFFPELPEGHPCAEQGQLRGRLINGVEEWETVTLDYDGPCSSADLVVTNR